MREFTFLPTEEYVKPIGRTVMTEGIRVLSLSGSGVEFAYEGTGLTVTFHGDSSTATEQGQPLSWRDLARVAVFVDGRKQLDTLIKRPEESYRVWGENETEAKEHIVRIVKLSEPRMSCVGLGTITVLADDNGTTPVRPTDRKAVLGFIGDSITCGYGVDGESEWIPFSTSTENVTRAYSYLTAELLDMEADIVSYSGHGLISGYTPDPQTPTLTELVQPYYEIFAYSYNTFRGKPVSELGWSIGEEPDPEILVINLGTNDDSYIQDDAGKRVAYEEAYLAFLAQVHACHPASKLVCAFGLMGDRLYEAQVRVVDRFKAQTGYTDVFNVRLTPQNGERDGYGCDWHPSAVTQRRAAGELAAFLKMLR